MVLARPFLKDPLAVQGSWLRFWGSASLDEGRSASTTPSPLDGPNPSFTFSWEDTLGQAGAASPSKADEILAG